MSSIILSGDTSGTVTLSAPAVAGSTTQTLVNATGTLAPLVSATAQTAPFAVTTYAEFTGIPSWAKRITVMFRGVSLSGTSQVLIQIGSGSITTSGYSSSASYATSAVGTITSTAGFIVTAGNAAASTSSGNVMLCLITDNTWTASGSTSLVANTGTQFCGGTSPNLAGALDRVRITTVNGTDTFDGSCSINIMYE